MKTCPSTVYLQTLVFIFTLLALFTTLSIRAIPSYAACYFIGSSDDLEKYRIDGKCWEDLNRCPSGQYVCKGSTSETQDLQDCELCVYRKAVLATCNPTASCLNDPQFVFDNSCPAGNCTGKPDPNSDCLYCVNPLCPVGACFDGSDNSKVNCTPCQNISCSVDANATGETSGQASSRVVSGQSDGYDGVNWYLNNSLIGTTAMNTDGTASNSFISLQQNTTYQVKAEYFDNQGGRPATSCTDPFTTGGQMTCSLTANNTTGTVAIPSGGTATWRLTSNPDGTSAVWRGTNDGVDIGSTTIVSPYPPSPWSATYTYNNTSTTNSVTDTRKIEIKNSSGSVACTTNEIALIVQAQPPPQLKTCSAGGQTGYCGNSSKQFPQSYRVNCGSGTLTYASSGDSSCSGSYPYCYICLTPQQATDSCPDETGNPTGGCGNNNYGLLGQCSGTWTYPGIVSKNNYCSQKAGATRPYCYTCTPASSTGGPSPSPGAISAGFTTGSIVVKGPLLLGRILQDINASFSIDSPDKLIEKLTSIVSGKVLTTLGLLDITGRMQNVLAHGAAIYHMWTNNCAFGCNADQQAVQQEIITGTGSAGAGSSNFIKISNSTVCTSSSGTGANCTNSGGSPGSYTRTTTYAQNPQQGFSAKLVQSASFTQGYSNNTNSVYTDVLSYIPTNVESKPCATGCTVQSKIELDYSTRQNNRVVSSSLNPDGTCFLKETACPPDSCSGVTYSLDTGVNQTYTLTRETYYQGASTTYSSNYYNNCTRYDIGRHENVTPWSVSFTSPVVVSSGSLAITGWYNLFEIVTPESCSYDANWKEQVNPFTARQYCTCQLYSFNDGSVTATYNCNYPLKSGKSFGDAPTGDYIFEVAASTTGPINYEITAGGTLARGSQSPSGGKLSIKFNVPDSAIGQRISIALNQTGRDFEEVTFGPPALYPVGWYEANINFGRAATTGLSQARVIDPPDDYPYTIGMIPPSGNYCSKTSNLEQCYLTLTPSTLRADNINQVDFLLGNIKSGGWFQVKDADLHAIGGLISRIPSSCKTPKCTPSFDLSGTGGFPGVPAYTGTSAFGSGTVSDKGWLAKSGYSGRRYNYNYFKSQVAVSKFKDLNDGSVGTATPDGLKLTNNDLVSLAGDSEANFAIYNGKIIIDQNTNLEGKKLVLFVGGDLGVKGQINLRDGDGFFAAIVQGSINVDPSVTSPNPNQYGLEGVFLADGAIHTGTNNPVPLSGTADGQLYIRGVLAGLQGVILERDLDPTRQSGANNDKPAETIEYAPDLVLNLPKELLRQGTVWREIAP